MGVLVTGMIGFGIVNAETRTNVQTVDGKAISSSIEKSQKEKPEFANHSAIENKFKDDSYSFALSLNYIDFENKVAYQDKKEAEAKERLRAVTKYLNDLTHNGTDFSAADRLQNDDDWTQFVEEVARLKYNDFDKSEILNDLNNIGALIFQAEGYYDEPSLKYLYEIVSDLNAGINGGKVDFNVSRAFGDEETEKTVYKYLQSKIK